MADGAKSTLSGFFDRLAELPAGTKLGIMIGTAAAIALLVGVTLWSRTPEFRPLYTNLNDRDGGLIISALSQMNIPYKFTEGGGAVLVPAEKVHEARLRLASQGLPKGSIVGFELLENQKLGVTQFQEQVNYQRALEGELARSIQSLAAVESARVHIAIPKQSVFLRDHQKPTASILLNLHAGRTLDRAQVSGIMHLVASSVADLPVEAVSVLDQNGTLLSGDTSNVAGNGLDPSQLAYLHQTEQGYIQRIVDIVEPIVGRDNVRAQVTADLDFSHTESTAETYKPNGTPTDAAIRSQQMSESSAGAGQGPQGVPGALSNQPPGNATAPITGGANNQARNANPPAASGPTQRASTVNYEVDKTVRHVRSPMGAIKRLSAAVVVNHRKQVDKAGKVTYTPMPEAQLNQIRALVKEAMGFSEQRGDSLNVVNTAFNVEEPVQTAPIPLWKKPETLTLAKEIGKQLLAGALVLYVLFGMLRPFFRKLAAQAPKRLEPALTPALEAAAEARPAAVVQIDALETARQLARQDPKLVANVVKSWVGGNE